MKMSSRRSAFVKFGGRCGYSGQWLEEDWQVDHIVAKKSLQFLTITSSGELFDIDHIDNLMPTFKCLNHCKWNRDLEEWREYLCKFHIKVGKLAKNPRSERGRKYKEYILSVAVLFGITPDNPFSGKFYFESNSYHEYYYEYTPQAVRGVAS